MTPALRIRSFQIGAHVQKLRPRGIVDAGGRRPHQVRLTAMRELDFRPRAAVRAGYEQQD
jgi:hypothetical protein